MVVMPEQKAIYPFLDEFKDLTGITLHIEEFPFGEMREKTLLELTGRTGRYDLVDVDCMWMAEYAAAGYLENLEPYILNPKLTDTDILDLDDFVCRKFACGGVWDDTIVSMQWSSGIHHCVIRKDLMEKHGIPHPPETVEEMYEVAEKMTSPPEGLVPTRNEFGFALILAARFSKTLPPQVLTFMQEHRVAWGNISAAAVVIGIPVIVFTLIVQKYLVRGLTYGAVK